MARAAIYARFSSHNQRDASIEDQVRACSEEAVRRGDSIVEVYSDRARSGTTTAGRDEFQRMMADSEGAQFAVLYVYKLDRFARNRYDSAVNRRKLRERGVELRPVAESVPEGPEGIVLEAMLEGMAEYYSANLSQNVRRGMEGNALKCMHNGARLYGYDLGSDGLYHVNDDEAKVVRMMFDMYDGGSTCPEIVEALAPYRTRRGKRFQTSHVMRMLRNEKYAGTYVFKEHRVPGGMEAIVDMEQFERVGARIGERKAHRPFRSRVSYPLSGRLHDEEGRPYVGVSGTARDGSKRCYYKCLETGVSWRREDVDEAARAAVAAMLTADEETIGRIADMAAAEAESHDEADRARAEACRSRVEAIAREESNLVDAIAQGVPASVVAPKLSELAAEREDLRAELAAIEATGALGSMRDMCLFVLHEICSGEAPAAMASAFVSDMVVTADGHTHVVFALDRKTPVDDASGVLMGHKWLAQRDCVRTVALRGASAWSCGFALVVTLEDELERPTRGRHW